MNTKFFTYMPLFIGVLLISACKADSDETLESNSDQINTTPTNSLASVKDELITVYKSPTCGCCQGWITYLEDEGFNIKAIDHDDMDAIKAQHGLHNDELKSCHTAIVGDYLIEGHVPANDIERLLTEKPKDIKGLTAPGMPVMSPGMASLIPKDYDVLSFTESGESAIYSQY